MSVFNYCPSRLISVTGPDSLRYLSGQLTQDITQLAEGESCYSFVCDAKGRIQFHLEVTKTASGFSIKSEASSIKALLARLDRFLIADDCELNLSDKVIEPTGGENDRIEAGLPLLCDLEDSFPAETGLLDKAVSFSKGCYQGQEVISRMKRAGKVNQRLVKAFISSLPSTLPFELLSEENQKVLFQVTSASSNETQGEHACLGYLKKSGEGSSSLQGSGGHTVRLT